MKVIIFKEDVAESYCEYSIGSMQKGCETAYDLSSYDEVLHLLEAVHSLRPGESLIVMKEGL